MRQNATECDKIKSCLDTNTRLGKPDEERGAISAGIGKIEGGEVPDSPKEGICGPNDRVIHAWQTYAGRHSEKTIEAYLTNIRSFEEALGGMPFEKITQADVAAYRDRLIALSKADPSQGGLSKATVRKRASQLRKFLNWLREQEGYRKLRTDIAGYLELPKAMEAKQLVEIKRAYPTIEEAVEMVLQMPSGVRVERRQRAMVACAFITGFRAGVLTTMRLKHLNVEAKEAVQDASEMRAKNGKSYRANWFPRTEEMHEVLIDWVAELRNLGFSEGDPLFPDHRDLHVQELGHAPIQQMKSEGAIAAAFVEASKTICKVYCPHSARHCLAALGGRLCRSKEEEKAWSLNLGHEKVATTEAHYGKMTDQNRKAVMLELHTGGALADDEKDLMLDFYQYRLTPGTEKFRRAKELIKKREAAVESLEVIE